MLLFDDLNFTFQIVDSLACSMRGARRTPTVLSRSRCPSRWKHFGNDQRPHRRRDSRCDGHAHEHRPRHRTHWLTDAQGHYSFPNLPVGRYDLTVTLDGFKPQKRTGLAVDADSALQIDLTLEVGEQTETVTVVENAMRVETASTQIGEVVPARR